VVDVKLDDVVVAPLVVVVEGLEVELALRLI
jgi:hypothetical protein